MSISNISGNMSMPITALSEGGPVIKAGTFSQNDLDGAPDKSSGNNAPSLPQPLSGGNRAVMGKFMAQFEDLIILMSSLAKQVQTQERMSEISSLESKVAQLMSSAAEKQQGADKLKSSALTSMIVGLVGAGLSLAGGVINVVGGLKSLNAATGGITKLSHKASEAGAKAASTAFSNAIGAGQDAGKAADAAQKAADKAIRGVQKAQDKILAGVTGSLEASGKAFASGAGFAQSTGQAENQMAQSRADIDAAQAERHGIEATRSQQMQQEMRDLLSKMVDLLNSYYQAQDKIASAASH
jgi:hypothetical protein